VELIPHSQLVELAEMDCNPISLEQILIMPAVAVPELIQEIVAPHVLEEPHQVEAPLVEVPLAD
jgi:hypothetical protein